MALQVQNTPVCMNLGCVSIANFLLDHLAPNFKELDPCDDWDELVCGGFRANHQPDNDFLEVSFATESKAELDAEMADLLERDYKPKNKSPEEKLRLHQHESVQDYFLACMDWHIIVRKGLTVPQEFFDWLTDKWAPIAYIKRHLKVGNALPEKWTDEEHAWYADITRKLAEVDVWVFAQYEPIEYHGENLVAVSPVVNIGLQSLENYEDKTMVEKYKNWMETHISKYIMWDSWDGGFWQDNVFEKIFEMEKDILRALPKPEELRKGYEEPWQVDMDTLEKVIPRLHLDQAILNHPDKNRNKFAQAKKPNIETVLLMQPKYWAKLNKILKDQPRDVMFLFQVWQGWRQLYNLWDGYHLTEWQEFLKEFDGKRGETRQQMCMERVRKHLPLLLDSIYINQKFPKHQRDEGGDMIRRLEYEVFSDIDSSEWLDDLSRAEMLSHSRDLDVSFGYSKEYPDVNNPHVMQNWYGNGEATVVIGEDIKTKMMRIGHNKGYHAKDRFTNWWNKKAATDPWQIGGKRPDLLYSERADFNPKSLERLAHAEDYVHLSRLHFFTKWTKLFNHEEDTARKLWHITANANSPHYNARNNHLTIPAGLLHYPVMDQDLPAYVKYALVGSAMGQGLAQALGIIASGPNATRLIDEGKWTKEAYDGFWHGSNCYNVKYKDYPLRAANGEQIPAAINNTDALNDLISDSVGTKAAFDAWKLMQLESEDEVLPGLERFTPEQLFFLFRSTRYCANTGPRYLENYMATGHAPAQLRSFAPLHELEAWRNAFQCKMPQDTCKVYGPGPQRKVADSSMEGGRPSKDKDEDEEAGEVVNNKSKTQPKPQSKIGQGSDKSHIDKVNPGNEYKFESDTIIPTPVPAVEEAAEPEGLDVHTVLEDKFKEIPGFFKSNWNPANPHNDEKDA